MPRFPRPFTGPRALWTDVVASVLAVGIAQAAVIGAVTFLDGGRGNGTAAPVRTPDGALVLERPVGFDPAGTLAPLSVTLEGSVSGLYPGATLDLLLEVRNPTEIELQLEVLHVRVGEPDRIGCPAEALLIGDAAIPGGTTLSTPLRLTAGTLRMIAVPVALATDADAACQGATFPLTYLAEGVLP